MFEKSGVNETSRHETITTNFLTSPFETERQSPAAEGNAHRNPPTPARCDTVCVGHARCLLLCDFSTETSAHVYGIPNRAENRRL
jgi:hypothetical protein